MRLSWVLVLCLAATAMLALLGFAAALVVTGSPLLAILELLGGGLAICVFVYGYRIGCEFLIVVFDMAETLTDIRNDLLRRK